jgi:hypothetical protein
MVDIAPKVIVQFAPKMSLAFESMGDCLNEGVNWQRSRGRPQDLQDVKEIVLREAFC